MKKRVKIEQEALLEYIRQNLSNEQIAEIEGVSTVTVWKHIKKIDEDLINKAKQEGQKEGQKVKCIERQIRLLKYIRQNLTNEQIAEKEGVSKVTIWSYLKEIDEDLLKQAEEEAKQLEQRERQNRLLGYIRHKFTREQMAKEEGVTTVTIWAYMKQIDKDLIKKAKQEDEETWQETKQQLEEKWKQTEDENEEKWKQLMKNDEEVVQRFKQKREEVLHQLEQRRAKQNDSTKKKKTKTKQKIIDKDYVKLYQEEIDEKYDEATYQEILLLIRLYIKTKQIDEAIKFLNRTIYNKDMEYLGVEKLIKMKEQLEKTKKEQQARKLIQGDKKTEEIEEIVGLPQIDIIRIKNEMKKNIGIEI